MFASCLEFDRVFSSFSGFLKFSQVRVFSRFRKFYEVSRVFSVVTKWTSAYPCTRKYETEQSDTEYRVTDGSFLEQPYWTRYRGLSGSEAHSNSDRAPLAKWARSTLEQWDWAPQWYSNYDVCRMCHGLDCACRMKVHRQCDCKLGNFASPIAS